MILDCRVTGRSVRSEIRRVVYALMPGDSVFIQKVITRDGDCLKKQSFRSIIAQCQEDGGGDCFKANFDKESKGFKVTCLRGDYRISSEAENLPKRDFSVENLDYPGFYKGSLAGAFCSICNHMGEGDTVRLSEPFLKSGAHASRSVVHNALKRAFERAGKDKDFVYRQLTDGSVVIRRVL